MSKARDSFWCPLFLFLVVMGPASAQALTLGDLAQQQRQKLLQDQKPPAVAAPQAAVSQRPLKPIFRAPVFSLHSIYSVNGQLVAEVTDGRSLVPLKSGSRLGGSIEVLRVDQSGIQVVDSQCKAKSPCTPHFVSIGSKL